MHAASSAGAVRSCGSAAALQPRVARHLVMQTVAPRPCRAWRAAQRTTLVPRRSLSTRSVSFEGPIPAGVQLEVKGADEGPDVEWDADNKVLRLPINVVEASGERRTKLVVFTCNKCGGRTARNVNPVAWEKGLVMGQCAHCDVWHVLSAKNKNIYEEIRYRRDEEPQDDQRDACQPPTAGSDSPRPGAL